MAEFPFEIATLSRFATRKQQAEIIERLEAGAIDIVIGTHRLAQPDVRFHNLGLVIIDEEQRFGVEVKERLKALRHTVDVLTMTATPIPRTLHMALLGLRDISNLQTPPEDRLAVETRVTRFDPDIDPQRRAPRIEPRRAGLLRPQPRLRHRDPRPRGCGRSCPRPRSAVGHAQMPEHELEQVMLDFVDRRFDVLLSTTIVESGLDIPNANTIFIDEADRYGLADLHQLRGRVGRYKHRAYCYLLIDPNKHVTPNAARRLRAIEEFSDLGAGFAVAMRDLEIRGAGNILGTEQSGHIAVVGYELYCELLEAGRPPAQDACRRGRSIEVDSTCPARRTCPGNYVPGMREKIDLVPPAGTGASPRGTARLRRRTDRPLRAASRPSPAGCWHWPSSASRPTAGSIHSIRMENRYVVFGYLAERQIRQLARTSGGRLRIVDARKCVSSLGSFSLRTPTTSSARSNCCCSALELVTIIPPLLQALRGVWPWLYPSGAATGRQPVHAEKQSQRSCQ